MHPRPRRPRPLPALAVAIACALAACSTTDVPDASPTDSAAADAARRDAAADASAQSPRLSIATWNLERFPLHAATAPYVESFVRDQAFDLVAVQEITNPAAFQGLANEMPDYEMVISTDSGPRTRVGFLYRPERITVGDTAQLFEGDTEAFPREPLMAALTVLGDDGLPRLDFTLVVVHLKALIDEGSRQRRVTAIRRLHQWLERHQGLEPEIVVVGDFNDELTDPPGENVFGPLLDAPERYRFLTMEAAVAGTASQLDFGSLLDHVLVTTPLLDEYGDGATEVLTPDLFDPGYRTFVSDHRPVVSRFGG